MAYADYQHCIVCDCKCFYDADIWWESQEAEYVACICERCSKDYKIVVVDKKFGTSQTDLKPWKNYCMVIMKIIVSHWM